MTTKYSNLAEYFDYRGRRFAERCTNCGECLQACPVFPLTKFAYRGPQAVIEKVTELLKGGEVSDEAYDIAFSCNGACGMCAKACPEGLMLYSAFMSAIAKIASAGKEPPTLSYQLAPGHRYNFANVFSSLQIKPSEERWIKKVPATPEPVDVVFFTGCIPAGIPHTLLEIVAILERIGVNFVTLAGDAVCCGSGPMLRGDLEASQSMSRHFVSTLAAFRPKKVVFFCHGCYMMCLGILPRFMSIPFESYELSQFLVENLDRIPFRQRINKVVTLHDSCSMARLGMFDPPRRLLQAIPCITLIEMEHNRENALCCGGLTNVTRPEITEPIRRAPLKEAKATGADILATICTGCQESFAPLERQYPFEVRSYVSLLAEAIGVRYEDRFKKYMSWGDVTKVLAEARDYIHASDFNLEEMERILPEYLNRFCLKHGQLSP